MSNYNTKLYVGLDVSEENIEIFILPSDSEQGKHGSIENSMDALKKFCNKIDEPSSVLVAMETGTHSAWMSELLENCGFQVLVGNARKLAAIWKNENKSDRNDAELLARPARNDQKLFAAIRHNPSDIRADLAVVKMREAVSECRTKLINTARGILRSFGIKDKDVTADGFTKGISPLIPKKLRPAFKGVVKEIRAMQLTLKEYDKQISKLCRKYPATDKVRQINGVGDLPSPAFVLLVGAPERFLSGDRVAKYFGLTPKRDQSGEVDKQLGITKCGSKLMRKLLVQAANHVMGSGPACDLRRTRERIAARGGKIAKRKAKVAVARKVGKLMYRLWLSDEKYDPDYKVHCKEARMNRAGKQPLNAVVAPTSNGPILAATDAVAAMV